MKLMKIIKSMIIYMVIASVLLLVGMFISGDKTSSKYGLYTTYNTDESGTKALYLLTDQMGYRVHRYKRPARFLPDHSTLVVIKPDWYKYLDNKKELDYLKKWLDKGNNLVFMDDDLDIQEDLATYLHAAYREELDSYGSWGVYSAGKGKIYMSEYPNSYTNGGLKNYKYAVTFTEVLDQAKSRNVYFNEYYHDLGAENITLWDIIGPNGEILIAQLLLGLIILAFVQSRRFGKPIVVFEITKRKENENVFAFSSIYSKAKANSLVLEEYLESFKKDMAKFLGFSTVPSDSEMLLVARGNKFLCDMELEALLARCDQYIQWDSKDRNQLMLLVNKIETIRKGIK